VALDLTFRDVTEATWPDFERLFNERGGPSHCWCCAWRDVRGTEGRSDKEARHDEMEQRVREGEPVGILAYLDGEPVAWCSVAPRDTYRPLGGPEDEPATSVWSVVCFFTKRNVRKQGVGRQLLGAAIERASEAGAEVVEAYPVDPDSPSYRFMGFRSMYLARGFEEVGRAGSRRHVVRLRLPGRRRRGAS